MDWFSFRQLETRDSGKDFLFPFPFPNVWERKEETKVEEAETSRKYQKFRERKSRFHYLCLQVVD